MKRVAFFLMGLFPLHLHAQQMEVHPEELQGFEKVRLLIPALSPEGIVGKISAFDGEHLVFFRGQDFSQSIRLAQIEALEVMDGKRRWGTAAIGSAVGAVIGFFSFLSYADSKYEDDTYNAAAALVLAAPIGGLVGAGIGAAIGRPRWVSVHLVSALEPGDGFGFTAGVGVSIRRRWVATARW